MQPLNHRRGVDYVKLDWCGDIVSGDLDLFALACMHSSPIFQKDEVWMGAAAHRQFAAALNRTGRPMYLEVKDRPRRDRFH